MSILEARLIGQPVINQPVRHQALIVLGKNIETGWTATRIQRTPGHLSTSSQIIVRALREVYTPGTLVVFSGGPTAGPGIPAEADAMWQFFSSLPGEIDPEDFRLRDRTSRDTRTNALGVRQIIAGHPSARVQMLTVSYHVSRALIVFANNGVRVDGVVASDKLLLQKNPQSTDVRAYQSSPSFRAEQLKEAVLGALIRIADPKGELLSQVTARTRS